MPESPAKRHAIMALRGVVKQHLGVTDVPKALEQHFIKTARKLWSVVGEAERAALLEEGTLPDVEGDMVMKAFRGEVVQHQGTDQPGPVLQKKHAGSRGCDVYIKEHRGLIKGQGDMILAAGRPSKEEGEGCLVQAIGLGHVGEGAKGGEAGVQAEVYRCHGPRPPSSGIAAGRGASQGPEEEAFGEVRPGHGGDCQVHDAVWQQGGAASSEAGGGSDCRRGGCACKGEVQEAGSEAVERQKLS